MSLLNKKFWVRKSSDGEPKMGVIPSMLIGLFLTTVVFYFSYQYIHRPKATDSPTVVVAPSKLTTTKAAIATGSTISVVDAKSLNNNAKVKPSTPDKEHIMVMNESDITIPQKADVQNAAVQQANNYSYLLDAKVEEKNEPGLEHITADDGRDFIKTRAGLFTAEIANDLKLTDATGKPLVYSSGELYTEDKDNVRLPLKGLPSFPLRDIDNKSYRLEGKRLRLLTPGGPGNFKGPDGKSYISSLTGITEQTISGTSIDTDFITGRGEFKGTDGKIYYISNGALFVRNTEDISFGADVIVGTGIFLDPSQRTLRRGADSHIYILDGRDLKRTNILGSGLFKGPDGAEYRKDSNSKITLIQPALVRRDSSPITGPDENSAQSFVPRSDAVSVSAQDTSPTLDNGKQVRGTARIQTNPGQGQGQGQGNTNTQTGQAAEAIVVSSAYTWNSSEPVAKPPVNVEDNSYDTPLFMPGQKIPFFTITTITSKFDTTLVEAVVAEDVYFFNARLPAGTKLIGSASGVAKNSRITINFNQLQTVDKRTFTLSGQVFDINLEAGLEVYYVPPPAWLIGLRYSNAYVMYKIQESSPRDQNNRAIGETRPIVEALQKTQDNLEARHGEYYQLPRGSTGILMLTAPLLFTEPMSPKQLSRQLKGNAGGIQGGGIPVQAGQDPSIANLLKDRMQELSGASPGGAPTKATEDAVANMAQQLFQNSSNKNSGSR